MLCWMFKSYKYINFPDILQDDLTHQLATIIKNNESLKKQEKNGAPAHIITEFAQMLQFNVATYFDNELTSHPRVNIPSTWLVLI